MFSVIIPVYNHERYIRECVSSAARSPLVVEILLMDDGSSDRSYQVVQALEADPSNKVRDLTSSPRANRGAHACLNHLASSARSEWIAVLNSDDVFLPGRFEVIAQHIRQNSSDFIFGNLAVIDQIGRQLGVKRAAADPELPFPIEFDVNEMQRAGDWLSLLSHQNIVATTSNMVFRKSLFERIGGFRCYRYVHDWDFALRACLLGKVSYVPHFLTSYRLHSSNTISEARSLVREEVRSLFAELLRDFPTLQSGPLFQVGMENNRYLQPRTERLLNLLLPECEESRLYTLAIEQKMGPVPAATERGGLSPDCEFVYAPCSIADAMSPEHLLSVKLALMHQTMDFALVSHSLSLPPQVAVGELRNHLVFAAGLLDVFLGRTKAPRALRGRVMRLLPGKAPIAHVEELFSPLPCQMTHSDVLLNGIAPPSRPVDAQGGRLIRLASSGKPVIFILPVFLAVGGVERLMLEIMRQLRDEYEFVLICSEQLVEGQGSLHGDAQRLALASFDLAELAPQEAFLPMMETLKRTFNPDLVWICNGSPWQCDHAADIRKVFANIPIIDQEAYDTEQGWIARYHEPGIQSFDRFIAINRKIREVFTGRLRMDPAKIDLIYHAINVDGLSPLDLPAAQKAAYARKYGVNPAEPLFAFIGRLTPQKQPLHYLELVRLVQQRGNQAKFLLIGDGVLAKECEAFIRVHKLTNVSRIPHCTVAEIYPLLSGLVVTSEYEGLPLVFLEAQASGVPALSTDVGDIRPILEEYHSGHVLSDFCSADALFSAWENFLRILPTYKANALKAAPLVRERFGGPTIATQYRNSFKTAVARFRATSEEGTSTTKTASSTGADGGQPATDESPPQLADRFRVLQHQTTVSVALCVQDGLDDVKRCLSSLIEYTYPPLEIILVDNGSAPATCEYLARFALHQGAILIRNETARGYAAAANQAIRASHGEHVVLLSSTTIVTEHWLDRMVMCASSDPRIGLVGPISSAIPELAVHAEDTSDYRAAGNTICDIARLVARVSGRVYPRIPFLNASCLLIKRSLLDAVGMLDEAAFGDDDGEDSDLCRRALAAGWQAAVADDTYVFHPPSGNRAPAAYVHDLAWCGLRARAQEMFTRQALLREGRPRWEGRRIAFLLPARNSCGSADRLLSEARAMQQFGVEVALVNLKDRPSCFTASDPNLDPPVLWVNSMEDVPHAVQSFDAVVATDYQSAHWLSALDRQRGAAVLGYYLLDLGEYSYAASGNRTLEIETQAPGMKLFSNMGYGLEEVRDRMGQLPTVVEPGVDVDLFRPPAHRNSDHRLNLCVMVRPSKESASGAMQALCDLDQTFHERIRIHVCLVGERSTLPASDFACYRYETMAPEVRSRFFAAQDILIDASFEALGQPAMEAMAAGVAVIANQEFAAGSPARNDENSLLVDTADAQACYHAAARLIEDPGLRGRLRRRATADVALFHPERVAANILGLLFPEGLEALPQ